MFSKIAPVGLGIAGGALVSVVCGLVYIAVLREPGSTYYLFARLAFLGGPIVGGIVAARGTQAHRRRAFFMAGGAVFGITFALFVLTYAVLPQFARTSVQLPAACDGLYASFDPPSDLRVALPGGDTGILIASDAETAVVALVDTQHPLFPSAALIVDRKDNAVLQRMDFGNDVISAAIADGIVYIYNDKLGYLLDSHTGQSEETFLLIDNYGGLSESDRPFISRASSGHWYMETTAVISSWHTDGTARSRPHLTFNGIARGCYIDGVTGEVTQLDSP
jgi:hypothetical protein